MSRATFAHNLMEWVNRMMSLTSSVAGALVFCDKGGYSFYKSIKQLERDTDLRKYICKIIMSATVEQGVFDTCVGRCDYRHGEICDNNVYGERQFIDAGGMRVLNVVKEYIDYVHIYKNYITFNFYLGDILHKIEAGSASGVVYILYTHKKLLGKDALDKYVEAMYNLISQRLEQLEDTYARLVRSYIQHVISEAVDIYNVNLDIRIYIPSQELIEIVDILPKPRS